MRRLIFLIVAAGVGWGCGASHPAPTQSLADVQAADRSARELGANSVPQANLHLQYAEEQTNRASRLMKDGDNERAAALLVRAKADAELAVALAHEQRAKSDLQEAAQKAKSTTTSTPGAQP
jgi:hypothetical protein